MEFEKEIFRYQKFDQEKGLSYGFTEVQKDVYLYQKNLMNEDFLALFYVKKGEVFGQLIDTFSNEEYLNFRIDSYDGEYINKVREAYRSFLTELRDYCFNTSYFQSEQANRIYARTSEMYPDTFEINGTSGIFSHSVSHKPYLRISKSTQKNGNLKALEEAHVKLRMKISDMLLNQSGFRKSEIMKENNWIAIPLNDSLTDEEIMQYISDSYETSNTSSSWIIPANPKYYDIIGALTRSDTQIWDQPKNISVGDTVYIYVTKPIGAILYKMRVIELDVPYILQNGQVIKVMNLKRLFTFRPQQFPLDTLQIYGLKSVRSARRIPKILEKELEKY